MKSKVCFLGVPTGFSTYPYPDEDGYYGQFYDTSHNQPWQFLIRQNKNVVRYIYIRYGLISGADKNETGRTGSLCGFSLELENYYLNCTVEHLLPFLHGFYERIVNDGILLKKEEAVHFQVKGFNQVSAYLNDRIAALKKIPYRLSDNLVKLETNLDVYAPPKITQFGSQHVNDKALNTAFLKAGWINIIPKFNTPNPEIPIKVNPTQKEKQHVSDHEKIEKHEEDIKAIKKQLETMQNGQNTNQKKNNTSKKTKKRRQKPLIATIIGTLVFLVLLGAAEYGTGIVRYSLGLTGNNDTAQTVNEQLDTPTQIPTEPNTSTPDQDSNGTNCDQLPLVQGARQSRKKNSYTEAIEKLKQAQKENPNCENRIANLIQKYKVARERHTKKTILHYINNEVYTEKKTDRYVKWSRRINWFSKANNLLGNHRIYAQYHAERKYDKIKCGYYLKITYPEKAKDCE